MLQGGRGEDVRPKYLWGLNRAGTYTISIVLLLIPFTVSIMSTLILRGAVMV
jgi:hypothetical protein